MSFDVEASRSFKQASKKIDAISQGTFKPKAEKPKHWLCHRKPASCLKQQLIYWSAGTVIFCMADQPCYLRDETQK